MHTSGTTRASGTSAASGTARAGGEDMSTFSGPVRPSARVRRPVLASVLVAVLGAGCLASCGSDDGDDGAAEGSGTSVAQDEAAAEGAAEPEAEATACTSAEEPLRIVLVNDDGVINPAIDVMIDLFAEQTEIDLEVTAIAPAEERSGTSDSTTPGGAAFHETTTPGGNASYAVEGFPADAVDVALDDLGLEPHLVVSGINPGQNFGPVAAISGTVGVGRTAVRRGIPALAVSGGAIFDEAQFEVGADLALDWIVENCDDLVAGGFQTDTVTSINLPACPADQIGPLLEVPRALELPEVPEGDNIFASSCDQSDPDPADDIAAVRAGYASITQVEPEL